MEYGPHILGGYCEEIVSCPDFFKFCALMVDSSYHFHAACYNSILAADIVFLGHACLPPCSRVEARVTADVWLCSGQFFIDNSLADCKSFRRWLENFITSARLAAGGFDSPRPTYTFQCDCRRGVSCTRPHTWTWSDVPNGLERTVLVLVARCHHHLVSHQSGGIRLTALTFAEQERWNVVGRPPIY